MSTNDTLVFIALIVSFIIFLTVIPEWLEQEYLRRKAVFKKSKRQVLWVADFEMKRIRKNRKQGYIFAGLESVGITKKRPKCNDHRYYKFVRETHE